MIRVSASVDSVLLFSAKNIIMLLYYKNFVISCWAMVIHTKIRSWYYDNINCFKPEWWKYPLFYHKHCRMIYLKKKFFIKFILNLKVTTKE